MGLRQEINSQARPGSQSYNDFHSRRQAFYPLQHISMSSPGAAKESHIDVLIIGAGPAGVMCANALARAGVRVRIVDKR